MVSDDLYELCLPILRDDSLDEEEKTDKLEELLKKEGELSGKPLENAVLDSLWRFRDADTPSTSPPPSRHTVIRKASPAPWQLPRTPTPASSSPRSTHPPPGFGVAPPAFTRAKSATTQSPFTSPRPSPRLAYAAPIPHSPNLNAYEFSDPGPNTEVYGDYGSDTVDWLVNDETASNASSSFVGEGGLNGAAPEWVQPTNMDMTPYDILRSVIRREDMADDDLDKALEGNNYDLSTTIMTLMDSSRDPEAMTPEQSYSKTVTVGKSMSPSVRPVTPGGQAKSNIMCKYWLSTGHCARADCRFSHDPSKTLCKYWMMGNCLAGDTCVFSHDPSTLMSRFTVGDETASPPQVNFQLQDYEAFPTLQGVAAQQWAAAQVATDPTLLEQMYASGGMVAPPPGLSPLRPFSPHRGSRPSSRPNSRSRNPSRAPTPIPSVDDAEAFPSLGSAASKGGKKHHGKRGGHGHHHKENGPNTLADLVRSSPSPSPAQMRKNLRSPRTQTSSREHSAAAQAIPPPEHIPWLETGESANKAYLNARSEAFRHGGLRNKFLQSAAQAWNRNDTRAAKALSLRGQSENNLMREAHREAARLLYEDRNKDNGATTRELFVDLHGLHPEEAVSYLSSLLTDHSSSARPLYAITGTGHHSKNGKDKVGKAVRAFLNEWRYAFREFSVPGDRGNVGGILGVDPSSWDRSVMDRKESEAKESSDGSGGIGKGEGGNTKIRILKQGEELPGSLTASASGRGKPA